MAADGEHLYEGHVWVPDIYRNVLIDETNPTLQAFEEQARSELGSSKEPRICLLNAREAQMISHLGSRAVNQVNEIVESGLPETTAQEIEVITTGLRIRTNRQSAKRFLTLHVADVRLFLERQTILESLYRETGKLPPFFKDFSWEVEWGVVKRNVDAIALPNRLEVGRPGSIKLGPAIIRKPKIS